MLQSMRLQTIGHDLVIEQQPPCGIGKSYFSNQGWNLNLFLWKRSNHWTTSALAGLTGTSYYLSVSGVFSYLLSNALLVQAPFVVQSLSHVQLFATPWTAAHQASLSLTISLSLRKLMSIQSVMPSNRLILCSPLLLLPSVFPSTKK